MYLTCLYKDGKESYTPTQRNEKSVCSLAPGMMIRPKGEALEIVYTMDHTESWDMYVQALDKFLSCEYCPPHLHSSISCQVRGQLTGS